MFIISNSFLTISITNKSKSYEQYKKKEKKERKKERNNTMRINL